MEDGEVEDGEVMGHIKEGQEYQTAEPDSALANQEAGDLSATYEGITETTETVQWTGVWAPDLSIDPQVAYQSLDSEFRPLFDRFSDVHLKLATPSNYLKHGKWSPDGSCFLTLSEDNCLRLFDMPRSYGEPQTELIPWEPSLRIQEGDSTYDYVWYPKMNPLDPPSCFLLSTTRGHPVHAYDGFTGQLKCSYNSFDHLDELATPISLSFNLDGSKIYCGFEKMIRVFDTSRPGREHVDIPTTQHTGKRRQRVGQKGVISCMSFSPDGSKLFAAGSYGGTLGLYTEDQHELVWMERGSPCGVSQVQFSYDGNYLISCGRKDPSISCWDIRHTGSVLFTMDRLSLNNQHIHFDIDNSGTQLIAASQDGIVRIYNIAGGGELIREIYTGYDSLNTAAFHPTYGAVAFVFGKRSFDFDQDISEEGIDSGTHTEKTFIQLWKTHMKWVPFQ